MTSYTTTIPLVVMICISCGNNMLDATVSSDTKDQIDSWLTTNMPNFAVNCTEEYQLMASAIASRLIEEQVEIQGKEVRVVDGGAVWFLMFPTSENAKHDHQTLLSADLITERLQSVKVKLEKIVTKGLLGFRTVTSFHNRVLKISIVFVTANEFLHKHQQKFIQTTLDKSANWKKWYYKINKHEDSASQKLLPMSARAILEAINHSEMHNGAQKGPILFKRIYDNIFDRSIIFEGAVTQVANNYVISVPQNREGLSPFDIKLNWILCGPTTEPSYVIVLRENGQLYIVGSCTEQKKIFQSTFAAPTKDSDNVPDSAKGAANLRQSAAQLSFEMGLVKQLNLTPICLQRSYYLSRQTYRSRVELATSAPSTSHDQKPDNILVKYNPYSKLGKGTSFNPDSNVDGPPIGSLLEITSGIVPPSETALTNVTPLTNGDLAPVGPVDVTMKLLKYFTVKSRPNNSNVTGNGNKHILDRRDKFENLATGFSDALFTAIITVQLGMHETDRNKYRLIRIQVDKPDAIELGEIREQAMYKSTRIFSIPEENNHWSVNATPVSNTEFNKAVEDGLRVFLVAILGLKGQTENVLKVSRCLKDLAKRRDEVYFGVAAQVFSIEDRDLVQLIIQISD